MSIFSKSTLKTPLPSVSVTTLKSGSALDVVVTLTPPMGLPFASNTLPMSLPCRKAEAVPADRDIIKTITRQERARCCGVDTRSPPPRCGGDGCRVRGRVYAVAEWVMTNRTTVMALAAVLQVGLAAAPAASAAKVKRDCINRREITTLRALDEKHVYVKAGASRHYLVTVDGRCHGLSEVRRLEVVESSTRVCADSTSL